MDRDVEPSDVEPSCTEPLGTELSGTGLLDTGPLDIDLLRSQLLAPGGHWSRLGVVARTGSTNADLLAAAATGAPDRTVLIAEHQDAGRGRLTRRWTSAPGSGLTLSVLLRPTGVPPARLGWLPLLTGLALVDAVRAVTAVECGLKWPNDLLLGDDRLKAAGILAEVADSATPAVVVGIGLNVAAAPPDEPGATCVAAQGGRELDRETLLVALLTCLDAREARWRAGGGNPATTGLRADYRAACVTLGAQVRVSLPDGSTITGVAHDVDLDGRLLLLDGNRQSRAVSAGDVAHVRPADGSPPSRPAW